MKQQQIQKQIQHQAQVKIVLQILLQIQLLKVVIHQNLQTQHQLQVHLKQVVIQI